MVLIRELVNEKGAFIMNIFEFATRNKLRFPFKGSATVEDLWELPVQDLDSIFKSLNAKSKQAKEESLLQTKSAEDKILETKIEIVKYIVSVKLDEAERAAKAKETKEQKQKIMAIMADKQDEALKNMSMDELQKELDKLNN